jgi:hypothetical protein
MTRPDADTVRLLHGPYLAPRLSKGDRAHCHLRDATVVVTSISNARVPWPRCRDPQCRGGSGLLVDDELLRALRTEAAVAVAYWWGVPSTRVSKWRRALGVERFTEGSRRLLLRSSAKGADTTRGVPLPAAAVAQRRQRAKEMDLVRFMRAKRWPQSRPWTARELKLLGTLPDEAVAKRVKRSRATVRRERVNRGIPAFTPAARLAPPAGRTKGRGQRRRLSDRPPLAARRSTNR